MLRPKDCVTRNSYCQTPILPNIIQSYAIASEHFTDARRERSEDPGPGPAGRKARAGGDRPSGRALDRGGQRAPQEARERRGHPPIRGGGGPPGGGGHGDRLRGGIHRAPALRVRLHRARAGDGRDPGGPPHHRGVLAPPQDPRRGNGGAPTAADPPPERPGRRSSDSNGDRSLDLEGRELRRHRCGRRSAMTAARDTRSMRTKKASPKTASRAKRAKAGKAVRATSRVAGKAGARGGRRPLAPRIAPSDVHGVLARHLLVDGFDLVLDLEKSRGRRLWDARSGR